MAVVYPKNGTATPSAGTFSVVIPMVQTHGICKQVIVRSATSSTTFDVKIIDRFSNRPFYSTSITGLINEPTDFPVFGDLTITVENASADEEFNYTIATLTES